MKSYWPVVLLSCATVAAAEPAEEEAVRRVLRLKGEVKRDDAAPGKPVVRVSLGRDTRDGGATKLDLGFLASFQHLRSLDLSHRAIDDAGLPPLLALKSLEKLTLSATEVSDEGLKTVAKLDKLEDLRLQFTKVRGPGLAHLAGLPLKTLYFSWSGPGKADLGELTKLRQLRVLRISQTEFGEDLLKDLAQLKDLRKLTLDVGENIDDGKAAHLGRLNQLETLELSWGTFGDASVKHLVNLKDLRHLQICHTKITDGGVKQLTELKQLTSLNLSSNPRLTADGVAHLKQLPQLEELYLGYLKLGDPAVRHLVQMKKLRHLIICRTEFSAEGLADLRKALPKCEVHLEPRRIDEE